MLPRGRGDTDAWQWRILCPAIAVNNRRTTWAGGHYSIGCEDS